MADIKGRITNILTVGVEHNRKNILTIESPEGKQTAYIEFRGGLKHVSDKYNVGDAVMVAYVLRGSQTPKGQRYNNVVALKIKHT